jgi:hypothetical protein
MFITITIAMNSVAIMRIDDIAEIMYFVKTINPILLFLTQEKQQCVCEQSINDILLIGPMMFAE